MQGGYIEAVIFILHLEVGTRGFQRPSGGRVKPYGCQGAVDDLRVVHDFAVTPACAAIGIGVVIEEVAVAGFQVGRYQLRRLTYAGISIGSINELNDAVGCGRNHGAVGHLCTFILVILHIGSLYHQTLAYGNSFLRFIHNRTALVHHAQTYGIGNAFVSNGVRSIGCLFNILHLSILEYGAQIGGRGFQGIVYAALEGA